jgi:hypothetical protein
MVFQKSVAEITMKNPLTRKGIVAKTPEDSKEQRRVVEISE